MIDQENKASEITNVDWDRHYSPTQTSTIMMTTGQRRIDDEDDNKGNGDTTAATSTNDRDITLDSAQAHDDNGSNDDQPNRDIVKMVTIEHVATKNNSEVQRDDDDDDNRMPQLGNAHSDDKGSFDMSYYRGQQRWHHHCRHSHPEH